MKKVFILIIRIGKGKLKIIKTIKNERYAGSKRANFISLINF